MAVIPAQTPSWHFIETLQEAQIGSLAIGFNIKRYKINTANCSVAFFTSTDGTGWTPQPAGDVTAGEFAPGAGAGTFTTPTTITKNVTANSLSISANGDFYLRWVFTNTGNTNSQGLGLDDVSLIAAFAVTSFYPATTATDLSQPSHWTTNAAGGAGTSPVNFTTANQLFNINSNVANPVVSNPWTISGGSDLVLNNTNPLTFTAASSFTIGGGSTANFNGKPVTLKSGATGTAFIGAITGTLSNASDVTVERYVSSLNNRSYRLLAPSVNTATSIRANW